MECRCLLTRSSSLDPIFSAGLTARVSGVNCPCPWFHANSSADSHLCCPVANSSQLPFPNNSLSCPLTTSGYCEISGPKILCLVSRQNRQRNRLLGGPPIECNKVEPRCRRYNRIFHDYCYTCDPFLLVKREKYISTQFVIDT